MAKKGNRMEKSIELKTRHRKERKQFFKINYANYVNCTRQLRKQKSIQFLREELAISTSHGLSYTVNQKLQPFERKFWAASFLLCIGLVVLLCKAQFTRFIQTPIVMSVEMDYFNWNLSYPAFTLCPIPPTIDHDTFAALINETTTKTGKNLESYLWAILSANIESFDSLDFPNPQVLPLIDPKEYTKIAARLFPEFPANSMTTNNNWPISVEMVMTELGMCHTINSNVAEFDNPFKWNSVTKYSKKNIELSVHDRDFFTQIMNYSEVYKVYIHSPDEAILATTSSYKQSLKGFMSFGVNVWATKISEDLRTTSIPLRRCRLTTEPINRRYPIYSYHHCMLECRIQMILKLCGCVPHFYKPLDNERICNLGELKCLKQHKKEILALSTSEKTKKKFGHIKGLPITSRDCKCLSRCESDIYQKDYEEFIPQSGINRLRIGISSFPKTRVVRDLIFSVYESILKIGGVLNLCVGASIISLFELVITLIKLIYYRFIYVIQDIRFE